MGATQLDREGGSTHEYDSLQLRSLRTQAEGRAMGLQQVDWTSLLLRRTLQEEEVAPAMRYRVRNHTDLPIREVRQLISFAGADLDFDRGAVYCDVRWTKPHRDRTNPYPAAGYCRDDNDVYMSLSLARAHDLPAPWFDRPYVGHELGMIYDWREALVAIAAHELKHLAERQRGCFKRGRLMEGRCDAYAYSRLMAYREMIAKEEAA
jgi:hypothetical protein